MRKEEHESKFVGAEIIFLYHLNGSCRQLCLFKSHRLNSFHFFFLFFLLGSVTDSWVAIFLKKKNTIKNYKKKKMRKEEEHEFKFVGAEIIYYYINFKVSQQSAQARTTRNKKSCVSLFVFNRILAKYYWILWNFLARFFLFKSYRLNSFHFFSFSFC